MAAERLESRQWSCGSFTRGAAAVVDQISPSAATVKKELALMKETENMSPEELEKMLQETCVCTKDETQSLAGRTLMQRSTQPVILLPKMLWPAPEDAFGCLVRAWASWRALFLELKGCMHSCSPFLAAFVPFNLRCMGAFLTFLGSCRFL